MTSAARIANLYLTVVIGLSVLFEAVADAQTVEDTCYTEYENSFLAPFGPCLSYNILEACVNDTIKGTCNFDLYVSNPCDLVEI